MLPPFAPDPPLDVPPPFALDPPLDAPPAPEPPPLPPRPAVAPAEPLLGGSAPSLSPAHPCPSPTSETKSTGKTTKEGEPFTIPSLARRIVARACERAKISARLHAALSLTTTVMAASDKNPPWSELIQLVPILSLAFPFVVSGEVDITRASSGFLVAALLTVPVNGIVLQRGHVLNPILVGTAIWLVLGALAFNVPVRPLASWLGSTQGFGLFLSALIVGVATTFFAPQGFIGTRHADAAWIRRASSILLAVAFAAAIWAYVFRSNVRLGGGLPFIVLNVVRRVMIVRAPPAKPA
jgi:hypothetical protein